MDALLLMMRTLDNKQDVQQVFVRKPSLCIFSIKQGGRKN